MQAISQHTQNLQHSTYSTRTSPQFQNACGIISSTSEEGRTDDGENSFMTLLFRYGGTLKKRQRIIEENEKI